MLKSFPLAGNGLGLREWKKTRIIKVQKVFTYNMKIKIRKERGKRDGRK